MKPFLPILLLLPAVSFASEEYDWRWKVEPPTPREKCLTYDAEYERAPLMKIALGNPKVYLLDKPEACGALGCAHRQKAYLVPGDEVLASNQSKGFRCVYHGTSDGKLISGFLPADKLTAAADESLTVASVAGGWVYEGNEISFSAVGGGKIKGHGKATWTGGDDEEGNPIVHGGEFDAVATIASPEMSFREKGEDPCEVRVRRSGKYLLVRDNGACGGTNVRFDGIYLRKKAATAEPQR